MPNINAEFSEKEFDALKRAKGDRDWRELILTCAVPETNRIGTYNPSLLKKRITAGQWPEIAKALHYFYTKLIAETGIQYYRVMLLRDARVMGYRDNTGDYDKPGYIALLNVDAENLTISTFSGGHIHRQPLDRPHTIFYMCKIVQDFLVDDSGKIMLDMPKSVALDEPTCSRDAGLAPDNDLHMEIQGEKERSPEIVRGFWKERKE